MLERRSAVLRRRFWHPFTGMAWVIGLTLVVAAVGLEYAGWWVTTPLVAGLALTAGFATSGST
ncbi:hypothetical protein [Micromonospora sp. DT229]|uniref:hypothetical protein n=1 Tax=Micromonospora sp. DT229 TaxID=3393430 RepID=UPI003CE82FEA